MKYQLYKNPEIALQANLKKIMGLKQEHINAALTYPKSNFRSHASVS